MYDAATEGRELIGKTIRFYPCRSTAEMLPHGKLYPFHGSSAAQDTCSSLLEGTCSPVCTYSSNL